MPLAAIDLGCHTARATTLTGSRTVRLRAELDGGALRPLASGVVIDVAGAARLVRALLRGLRRFPLGPWQAVVGLPGSASPRARAALARALEEARVRVVTVVPETLAAAIGCGLDVGADYAQMIVDVGHGVTDVGVIRAGRLIATAAPGPGVAQVQQALADAIELRTGVRIERQAAEASCAALARLRARPETPLVLRGHTPDGRARDVELTGAELLSPVDAAMARIVAHVAGFVRGLPAGVGCEVIESGIALSGGGARLDGLATRLEAATCVAVRVAAEPQRAVLRGALDVLRAARPFLATGWSPRFALGRELR